ncbi:hypothetical protein [Larkinella soli]|uniref:hypothetical protein n=1 Tax=Larkinella soli TaxID=1770527 RepID=UPI000FFC8F60|nr:hypothetical protein [Larkinella soli]
MKRLLSARLMRWAFRFWLAHGAAISGLMLISAVGRAAQMKAAGPIPGPVYWGLEVVVESARVLTLLIILGDGNFRNGVAVVTGWFQPVDWKWSGLWATVNNQWARCWPEMIGNLLWFALTAWAMNQLISMVSENRVMLDALRERGLLHPESTGMPIVFFLKNLTVIPLTVIFEYGFLRWLTGNSRVWNSLKVYFPTQ